MKMDATQMLQIHLDNSNLRKDMINLTGKLNEKAKDLKEVKLRHIFEMDEIKYTYEEQIETIQRSNNDLQLENETLKRTNTNLQIEIDKYENKVLALHELKNEKDELVVEMKNKYHESQQKVKIQKTGHDRKRSELEKKIQSVQSDLKAVQLEYKNIKLQCQALEHSNAKLTDALEAKESRVVVTGDLMSDRMSSQRNSVTSSLSDYQLKSELNELHTLLKEKSKTIRKIKKERNANFNHYGSLDKKTHTYRMSGLEDELKTVQSENERLQKYCEELEKSKQELNSKLKSLENYELNEENWKKEIEELRKQAKEKEETITWIETKMLESFDSMASKTHEYEDKLSILESENMKLQMEIDENKLNDIVVCRENIESMDDLVLKPIELSSEIEMTPPSPLSIVSDAPSKLLRRGGFKRIFSRSFRKFIGERGHKDRLKDCDDNESMFYVSEKD